MNIPYNNVKASPAISPYAISLEPEPPLEQMDLQTIIKRHLCGSSHGKVSECRKCTHPCEYGERALQLVSGATGQLLNAAPPLYNGKTMLQNAREELSRRKEAEKEEAPKTEKPPRQKRVVIDDWYDKAYESGHPLQWIMETFNMTEHKAKQKVYVYQSRHPGLKDEKPMWEPKRKTEAPEVKETPAVPKESPKMSYDKDSLLAPLENKINALMNKQEECKKEMDRLKKEYEQKLAPVRKEYEDVKTKVDALYEALNILNE